MKAMPRRRFVASLALLAACSAPQPAATPPATGSDDAHARLPTGVHLDPVAPLHVVGQMPLAMVDAPEGDRVVLLMNG